MVTFIGSSMRVGTVLTILSYVRRTHSALDEEKHDPNACAAALYVSCVNVNTSISTQHNVKY